MVYRGGIAPSASATLRPRAAATATGTAWPICSHRARFVLPEKTQPGGKPWRMAAACSESTIALAPWGSPWLPDRPAAPIFGVSAQTAVEGRSQGQAITFAP